MKLITDKSKETLTAELHLLTEKYKALSNEHKQLKVKHKKIKSLYIKYRDYCIDAMTNRFMSDMNARLETEPEQEEEAEQEETFIDGYEFFKHIPGLSEIFVKSK